MKVDKVKTYKITLMLLACIGLLSLFASSALMQTGGSSEIVLDPADPLENDIPPLIAATQNLQIESINPRHAHLTFNFLFRNDGPGEVTRLDVFLPIPSNYDNQRIYNLSFTAPYTVLTDRYNQPIAYFKFTNLAPGQQATVSWGGDVEVEAKNYNIDPGQVTGLDQIPPDIISAYTTNENKYRLESQIIQDAAQVAANGATNPYWIAHNVHDFVANRLTYFNDHQWDDAETVYLQQHGSCSEYTFLFIALCRANGVPARYVGGTRQRQDGIYVDTVFHRWAEVYLPPYGWVPIDVTHDDIEGGLPVYTYFGAITDERFAVAINGGDSEYLGWNYHSSYRYYYTGSPPNRTRERSFIWQSYPSKLQVNPPQLTSLVLSTTNTITWDLDIISTNGSYDWSLVSADNWLQLDKGSGTTPDTIRLVANTTGFPLGIRSGQIVLNSSSLNTSITVPVNIVVVNEIFETYLPIIIKPTR
ncbi:MAG: hypothetical protein GY807_02230 [Gammaproteobacteria bacterium]|nr:hypothetical protein [Gammaproteobacteria bacterium]